MDHRTKIFTKRLLKSGLTYLSIPFLLIFSLAHFSKAYGQAANLDQIRNGMLGVYSTTPTADWVNGNAGPSNAHFAEGYSIPYRATISGLVGNSSTVHHLIIEWDTKHGNGHAIDYITHYQNLDNPTGSHLATFGHGPEVVNPTMGTSFSGAPSLFDIPAPSSAGSEVTGQPTASFNALPGTTSNANIKKMAIWGGTIVSLTYVFQDPPDGTTAQTETRLDIAFTSANGSTALIAWAGHIAAEYDWGPGRGATGVSGSPYHTRVIEIDGKPGNQDRSLKATAVIIPPPVCGISDAQLACVETPFLTFTAAGSSTGSNVSYEWTLTNGSPSAGAKIDPVTGNTGFTVKIVPVGTAFTAGTFSLSLKVNKTGAQSTTCSKSPAGTIIDVNVTATATSNTSAVTGYDAVIDRTLGNTSQLNAIATGGTAPYTFKWSDANNPNGSFSDENIANPVYTVTANGEYFLKVVATESSTAQCKDSVTLKILVVGGAPNCKVTGPSPICPGSTNTYKYDPDENGVADPIPANFTALWTLENNTNNASISGSATGNSVSVVSSGGLDKCNTAYRIKITLTSTSGLITTSCFKDVSVKDDIPPTITNCPADVTIECSASSDPANTGTATATDNCSATVTFDDVVTPGCYTIITRTWTATDPCGNTATCVQRIIKRDRTAPVITCPTSGNATATDNCTPTNQIVLFFRDAGTVRTWTAIDLAGNTNTCTQTISVVNRVANDPTTSVTEAAVENKSVSTATTKIPVSKSKIPVSELKVNAYPNPYNSTVNFQFVSPTSGKVTLELYDLLGRKLGIVYDGNVSAGVQKTISYKVPALKNVTMIYKLRAGDKMVNGKLLPARGTLK